MTPSKYVVVDYNRCKVEKCYNSDKLDGCPAAEECSKDLLIQEEKDEPPILRSSRMCDGCGECVSECLFSAIQTRRV